MRLAKWTDEDRLYFNQLRVRGRKIADALRVTLADRPDAEHYEYQTVLAYTNSTQGSSDLRIARDSVTEAAKEDLLASSGGRLDMLTEVAAELMDKFRDALAVRDSVQLAGEIRGIIKEIRMEVDPLGLEGATGQSHFEKMLSSFETLKDADKDRILAVSEATWVDPLNHDAN
jgi:hypothetical protein